MVVLIITMDDLIDERLKWSEAFNLLSEKELLCTVGVITESYGKRETDWEFIESHVNNGLIEVASHSQNHPRLPYKDYDSEIGGSKQDILENLGIEVTSWICPHGRWDDVVLEKLNEYNYSVLRGGSRKSESFRMDNVLKVCHSIEVGEGARRWSDVNILNNHFKNIYERNEVYHLLVHPQFVDWSNDSYMSQHLDYILEYDILSVTLGGWRQGLE